MIFENRLFPPVPLEGTNFCVSYADGPETMVRIHAILLKQWKTRGILLRKENKKIDKTLTTQITGRGVIDCWCHEGDAQATSSRSGAWVSLNILNQPFCPPQSIQVAPSEILNFFFHSPHDGT